MASISSSTTRRSIGRCAPTAAARISLQRADSESRNGSSHSRSIASLRTPNAALRDVVVRPGLFLYGITVARSNRLTMAGCGYTSIAAEVAPSGRMDGSIDQPKRSDSAAPRGGLNHGRERLVGYAPAL